MEALLLLVVAYEVHFGGIFTSGSILRMNSDETSTREGNRKPRLKRPHSAPVAKERISLVGA